MPGGFARVADQRDARVISMQQGGGSIDVWITSKGQEIRPVTLLSNRTTRFERRIPGALPARAVARGRVAVLLAACTVAARRRPDF